MVLLQRLVFSRELLKKKIPGGIYMLARQDMSDHRHRAPCRVIPALHCRPRPITTRSLRPSQNRRAVGNSGATAELNLITRTECEAAVRGHPPCEMAVLPPPDCLSLLSCLLAWGVVHDQRLEPCDMERLIRHVIRGWVVVAPVEVLEIKPRRGAFDHHEVDLLVPGLRSPRG